ncbi:MAG: alpha/beta hydrolase [Salegentibacter sp.]
MFTEYKNAKINFTSEGKGRPLVLLHGFLESLEIWKDFVPELARERQVICIDLPGHGKSGCFGKIHTMQEMAGAVHRVLKELKLNKVSLAGHSMGGYVSLEFLAKFPTMTRAVVLVNSTPASDSAEKKENRDRATVLVQKNKKAYVKMAISNLVSPADKEIFKKEVEELKTRAITTSAEGIAAALQGMKVREDHTQLLKEFSGYKKILTGKEDPVMEYEIIKILAETNNIALETASGGHLSYIEDQTLLRKLLHFID